MSNEHKIPVGTKVRISASKRETINFPNWQAEEYVTRDYRDDEDLRIAKVYGTGAIVLLDEWDGLEGIFLEGEYEVIE